MKTKTREDLLLEKNGELSLARDIAAKAESEGRSLTGDERTAIKSHMETARKAHGANKPPRLMARLIEFFSRTGELVLDPFAGVGGTLLGAAIARGPRRAIGIELEPRWASVFEGVVRDLTAERDGLGPELVDLGPADPGGPRAFDASGVEHARSPPAMRTERDRSLAVDVLRAPDAARDLQRGLHAIRTDRAEDRPRRARALTRRQGPDPERRCQLW